MAKPNRPSEKGAPNVATARRTTSARSGSGNSGSGTSKPAAPKAPAVEIRQQGTETYQLGADFDGTFVAFASIPVSDVEAAQANTAANTDEAA